MDAVADPAPDKMREPALAILLMEDMALTSASDRIESFLLERGPRSGKVAELYSFMYYAHARLRQPRAATSEHA